MKKNANNKLVELANMLQSVELKFRSAFSGIDYDKYLFEFGYITEEEYTYRTEYVSQKSFDGNYKDCLDVEEFDFHCEAYEMLECVVRLIDKGYTTMFLFDQFDRGKKKLRNELVKCWEMTGASFQYDKVMEVAEEFIDFFEGHSELLRLGDKLESYECEKWSRDNRMDDEEIPF